MRIFSFKVWQITYQKIYIYIHGGGHASLCVCIYIYVCKHGIVDMELRQVLRLSCTWGLS